jgi:hypothetical protein
MKAAEKVASNEKRKHWRIERELKNGAPEERTNAKKRRGQK